MKYLRNIFMLCFIMLWVTSHAHAYSTYTTDVKTKYPNLGTNLTTNTNNCYICHKNAVTGAANATLFGQTLRRTHLTANVTTTTGTISVRLGEAESLDSDGDGATNLEEITADTDLNDPASKPTAPTSPSTTPTNDTNTGTNTESETETDTTTSNLSGGCLTSTTSFMTSLSLIFLFMGILIFRRSNN